MRNFLENLRIFVRDCRLVKVFSVFSILGDFFLLVKPAQAVLISASLAENVTILLTFKLT